jgi:hypothetical protein
VRITEIDVPRDGGAERGGSVAAANGCATGIGRSVARHHRTRGDESSNDGEPRHHALRTRLMRVTAGDVTACNVTACDVVCRCVHGERT